MSELVDRVLSRADDLVREAQGRQEGAPLDPRVASALSAVTGPGASLPARSVAERVHRGALTWGDLWRDPHARGPEAVRVVQTALVELARRVEQETPPP